MARQKQPKQRALATACLMALAFAASNSAFAQDDLERKALETVAARLGVSTDALALENLGAGAFDLQKLIFYNYKFSLKDKGTLHSIALSDAGDELALESLIEREQALYVDKYGRVDKRLVDTIANTDPGASVEVVLWAKQSRDVSLDRPESQSSLDDKQIDSLYAQLDAERADIAKESTERLVSQLEAEGFRAEADELTPSISVSIPAKDVRRISEWADVSTVYQAETFDNKLAISGNSIAAYPVHATGNTGQNVPVAQIEVGGQINLANPWLAGVVQDNINSCYNNHGTNVAGAIRSTHGTQRGIAPGVRLRTGGSCAGNETQLRNASNRATAWGRAR